MESNHTKGFPMARFIKGILLLSALMLALVSIATSAQQQNPKRLILKDGSYQTVIKWEIAGSRVRYYSAERFSWEEVPNSLVDWPATEKYNQERESQRAASVQQIARDDEAAEPATPAAAPGVRLPEGGGVFLLDAFQGQPQLLELEQNGGELNKHAGRNILRAAINPLAHSKQTIELAGERAKMQSHLAQPTIYVNVDSGGSASQPPAPPAKGAGHPPDRYGIVRLEKKKGTRVVGRLSVAVYGQVSEQKNWIKATSVPVGDWVKIVPDESLVPGEYAVVELLEKGQINLYVWDFGVDTSAPANAGAWTPRQPAPGPAVKKDEAPALEKRPK